VEVKPYIIIRRRLKTIFIEKNINISIKKIEVSPEGSKEKT
jgi:hypothetical protein